MTNKDFKEGMEVTCEYKGEKLEATLSKDSLFTIWWASLKDKGIAVSTIQLTNIQPKLRTIDDLECGDYVVDSGGTKRKCLGRCEKIVFMSMPDAYDHCDGFDLVQYYKKLGYTLYQPTEEKEEVKETDIDRCIKVVEYMIPDDLEIPNPNKLKYMILLELKNLKK